MQVLIFRYSILSNALEKMEFILWDNFPYQTHTIKTF